MELRKIVRERPEKTRRKHFLHKMFPRLNKYYICAVENKLEHIVHEANNLFLRRGIKSTTMDDIARYLGISKKTLYKYLTDKNDLVSRVLNYNCNNQDQAIEEIVGKGLNAIDESFEVSHYIVRQLNQIHPSIHFDLEKYHPISFNAFKARKEGGVFDCHVANMEKGIEEGLYRDDLNVQVVARIYTTRIDMVFDDELFSADQYSFGDVYREMFHYHIRGIASEKGIRYLQKRINQEKSKPQ